MKQLETASTVAVLLVSLLAAFFMIHDRLATPSTGDPTIVGHSLSISGVTWNSHKPTVVLAISTQCHFCTSSTSFYKTLEPVS